MQSRNVREGAADSGDLYAEMILSRIRRLAPKVHCLTNPVTMNDVANVLLAAGGSAIMASAPKEVAEITAVCQATLLNTGVPDAKKIRACILAGKKANELGHPVVLDPVGVGASAFRRRLLTELLTQVRPTVIRCNQGEAAVLLSLISAEKAGGMTEKNAVELAVETAAAQADEKVRKEDVSGKKAEFSSDKFADLCRGVESGLKVAGSEEIELAGKLAAAFGCTVLVTGVTDVVSDGEHYACLSGGDERIRRITGGGCMLSALCALFSCAAGSISGEKQKAAGDCMESAMRAAVKAGPESEPAMISVFDTVCRAGQIWKDAVAEAGRRTDKSGGGIGTFHVHLFDALEALCGE